MTFNLLGNENAKVNTMGTLPQGEYKVFYEYQLPTLTGNPNPANLDARLRSVDFRRDIYCEMKMPEWISNGLGTLRGAYLEPDIPQAEAQTFI